MTQPDHPNSMDEALADCLDAFEHGENNLKEKLARFPGEEEELVELLSLVQTLKTLGGLTPRDKFLHRATQKLVARLPNRCAPVHRRSGVFSQLRLTVFRARSHPLIVALTLMVLIFVVTGGTLFTASAARPDELLYSLSLRLEQVQLDLVTEPEAHTKIHLAHADRWLRETQNKLDDGDIEATLLALSAYEKEILSASEHVQIAKGVERDALYALLYHSRKNHIETLRLLANVPQRAQAAIQHAIDLIMSPIGLPTRPPEAIPTTRFLVGTPQDDNSPPEDPLIPLQVVLPTVDPGIPASLPVPPEVVLPTIDREPPANPVLPLPEEAPPVEPGRPEDVQLPPMIPPRPAGIP